MSPYALHRKNWEDCERCPLHRTRRKVVLCRGQIPAEVLFIGEGPGESEDMLGVPFIGPAGKLLDRIIARAIQAARVTPTMCWTNLVGCIPKAPDTKRKSVEPLPGEIASCWPRLDEFIDICGPTRIIAVGELAEKQAKIQLWAKRASVTSIIHPAAILRMGVEQRGLILQRCEVQLTDAFAELIPF